MSEPLDLDGIEARANAASRSARVWTSEGVEHFDPDCQDEPWWDVDGPNGGWIAHAETREQAEHIAGMDPVTTLALVSEVRVLREDAEYHREGYEHDQAEIAHLQKALHDTDAEVQALRAKVEAIEEIIEDGPWYGVDFHGEVLTVAVDDLRHALGTDIEGGRDD